MLEVDGQTTAYSIPPGSVFVNETGGDIRPPATSYGIIRADEGQAPSGFALVMTERRDGSLSSAHSVSSHQEGTLFWAPVDTYPSLLRHGDIEAELSLVNEGTVPATVYLELFDIDGNSTGKVERIVPLGRRVQLSLEDAFGRSPLRGTLRVFSDVQVVTVLQRRITNIVGELVVTDIPLQPAPQSLVESIIFPLFTDGSGSATELLMINTGRRDHSGSLRIRSQNGKARTMILR